MRIRLGANETRRVALRVLFIWKRGMAREVQVLSLEDESRIPKSMKERERLAGKTEIRRERDISV